MTGLLDHIYVMTQEILVGHSEIKQMRLPVARGDCLAWLP